MAATAAKLLGNIHPLALHRRNHLVFTLILFGHLKTLLTGPELPVASDVAVPWDIAYLIGHLNAQLGTSNSELLTALVAALNDRANISELEKFPEWRNQPPIPLTAPWPE